MLSDAWIIPIEDLGRDEKQLHCRTHLGHILKVGDVALGYNLLSCNFNNADVESLKENEVPSVVSGGLLSLVRIIKVYCFNQVLVKKSYCSREKRQKSRNWKLQYLDKEMDVTTNGSSYQRDHSDFMDNLEEDESFRNNINVYLSKFV